MGKLEFEKEFNFFYICFYRGLLEKNIDIVDPNQSGYISVTLTPGAISTVVFK